MSFDARKLYELLPAIYRIRDAEQGTPLEALLAVVAEQVAVVEESLAQLYDDQFIETCADWAVPYIGDLIGYRSLHGVVPKVASPRAEVANTIAFRRRKGTASMLEQLARDVTGWEARVVEFFQLLATTQYLNHLRPQARWSADLRRWEPLERIGTAFDSLGHTVDVRRIAAGAARHNIPNIGIFLWRLRAHPLTASPVVAVDDLRYRLSPLGHDLALFTRPVPEERITHLAEPLNAPLPIGRRALHTALAAYYGEGKSLVLYEDGQPIALDDVEVCNLSDTATGWAHVPTAKIAIDPVLGRIAFPTEPGRVTATFHYGFSADLGGGEYERAASFTRPQAGQARLRVPDDHLTIQLALDALPAAGGVVEITDSGRYTEALAIDAGAGSIEVRAANGHRPTLVLPEPLTIRGGAQATVTLNGLLVAAHPAAGAFVPGLVSVPAGGGNALRALRLRHCTLVPGLRLDAAGAPVAPDTPGLVAGVDELGIEIESSIVGGLRIVATATASLADSILDATDPTRVAYAALDGAGPGGALTASATTVVGKVHAAALPLVSNSILLAALAPAGETWTAPVRAERKQQGCLRFSCVPPGTVGPHRHRCQPDLEIAAEIERREKKTGVALGAAERAAVAARIAGWLVPGFTALRYGLAGYGQLRDSTPGPIRTGADDEAEMGAFHALYQPQRETNLRVRLDEYLRFGLEAGVIHAS